MFSLEILDNCNGNDKNRKNIIFFKNVIFERLKINKIQKKYFEINIVLR